MIYLKEFVKTSCYMFIKYHCSQNRKVNRPIVDSLWPHEVVPRDLGQELRQVLPRSECSWSPSWLSTSSSLDIFGRFQNQRHCDKDHQHNGDGAHLKEEDDSLVASVVPLTDTHAVFHLCLDCHGFRSSFFLVSKS